MPTFTCECCGEPFERAEKQPGRPAYRCAECRRKNRGRPMERPENCLFCGTPLVVTPYSMGRPPKYCRPACRQAYYRRQAKRAAES